VADVQKTAVEQWVSEMSMGDPKAVQPRKPKGATLVIRAYGVPAAVLDDAVSDRRTMTNPARGMTLPRKVKKPHVYLSHDQMHGLAAASKYPTLVLVLAYCGLRWAGLLGSE
jgi:integrase